MPRSRQRPTASEPVPAPEGYRWRKPGYWKWIPPLDDDAIWEPWRNSMCDKFRFSLDFHGVEWIEWELRQAVLPRTLVNRREREWEEAAPAVCVYLTVPDHIDPKVVCDWSFVLSGDLEWVHWRKALPDLIDDRSYWRNRPPVTCDVVRLSDYEPMDYRCAEIFRDPYADDRLKSECRRDVLSWSLLCSNLCYFQGVYERMV